MKKQNFKPLIKKILIILAFILILAVFLKFGDFSGIALNKTSQTAKPFQENVNIDTPEGVVKIGRGGRIKIV